MWAVMGGSGDIGSICGVGDVHHDGAGVGGASDFGGGGGGGGGTTLHS